MAELHWFENDGGPLAVMPRDPAPLWEGGAVPSRGRVVRADFRYDGEVATDYDRACDVNESARVLEAGDGWVLVLGGVVQSAAWYPMAGGSDFAVISVEWLPDTGVDALAALYSAQPASKWQEIGLQVRVGDGGLLLMHAAGRLGEDDERRYDAPGPSYIGDAIAFPAAPGRYRVETCEIIDRSDPRVASAAAFVRFSRLTS
jgi:hypothetical protein